MKNLIFLTAFILLLTSCQKDEISSPIPEPVDPNIVIDIDGNVYHAITIGNQTWMKENLKTTHFRNGDPIPNVTDDTAWSIQSTGAYANYNNDSSIGEEYGRLYNWYAVHDARNVAPTGWHVPTDAELNTLVAYLGGESEAGGKLKEKGTAHWASPNSGATNESGFTALPGGWRDDDGSFNSMGLEGYIWSSVAYDGDNAWEGGVFHSSAIAYGDYWIKVGGNSVRCVKD